MSSDDHSLPISVVGGHQLGINTAVIRANAASLNSVLETNFAGQTDCQSGSKLRCHLAAELGNAATGFRVADACGISDRSFSPDRFATK